MGRVSSAQYKNRKEDPVSGTQEDPVSVRVAQNEAGEVGKGQIVQRQLVFISILDFFLGTRKSH